MYSPILVCDCVIRQDGQSPLHLATDKGHLEVCKLLLDNGADINKWDMVSVTIHKLASYTRITNYNFNFIVRCHDL
jgi:ankyrin repeat protein